MLDGSNGCKWLPPPTTSLRSISLLISSVDKSLGSSVAFGLAVATAIEAVKKYGHRYGII